MNYSRDNLQKYGAGTLLTIALDVCDRISDNGKSHSEVSKMDKDQLVQFILDNQGKV